MIFESVILSIIVGYIRKGRLKNFEYLQLKWWYLLTVAYLLQVIAIRWDSLGNVLFYILHMSSYVIILYICFENRQHLGIRIFGIGTILNGIVIAFNQGSMPVNVPSYVTDPPFDRGHMLMTEATRLSFLGDIFAIDPFKIQLRIFSIGDFFLMIGIFMVIQKGMILKQEQSEQGNLKTE